MGKIPPYVTKALFQTICYINLPLCLIVILVVALNFREHHFGDRVCLASIALSDMLYSITQLILANEATDIMSMQSLRTIFFLKYRAYTQWNHQWVRLYYYHGQDSLCY